MSTFPFAALLFDLDGTLVDSAPDLTIAANQMLAALGRPVFDLPMVASWIGDGVPRLIKRALTGERWAEPEPQLFLAAQTLYGQYYEAHIADHSTLYPRVIETLEVLREQGFRMGCVTNKAARFTAPLLAALGLASYFEVVLSGDSLAQTKPDPYPLIVAADRLGVALDGVVMVGDSGNDMRAAKAAGMQAVAVSYGYNNGVDLEALGATVMIDDFGKLPDIVRLEGRFLLSKAVS
ncbi:MAG TPA: phosphoglycolate phosphatase [Acidiferrobacter sp.]|nr:phosphoglycolate phosphatase [Acidiferrobacter sp.]